MLSVPVGDGWAHARFSTRADGDMGHGGTYAFVVDHEVRARRQSVLDLPWTWLRQVHGDTVVAADGPGSGAGSVADGAWTHAAATPLAILTADCAPVALASPEGVVGAAHAGWSGVMAGIVESTVQAMRAAGATDVHAVVGPCICPGCYEFGAGDLEAVESRLGPTVRSSTRDGCPALDLRAVVRAALGLAGVNEVHLVARCTSCDLDADGGSPTWFSWRARRERQRQAMVVWR